MCGMGVKERNSTPDFAGRRARYAEVLRSRYAYVQVQLTKSDEVDGCRWNLSEKLVTSDFIAEKDGSCRSRSMQVDRRKVSIGLHSDCVTIRRQESGTAVFSDFQGVLVH